MRSQTVAQLLATLGITKSHSRPHVSDDNPFSESQFKTLKYRPEFPDRFASIEHGLEFCGKFFHWQNHEHHHWGLGLLTPAMVHYGAAQRVRASGSRCSARPTQRIPNGSCRACPRPLALPRPSGSIRRPTLEPTAMKKGFQRSIVPGSPMHLWRTLDLAIPRRVASPQSPTPFHQATTKLTIQPHCDNTLWTPESYLRKSRGLGAGPQATCH